MEEDWEPICEGYFDREMKMSNTSYIVRQLSTEEGWIEFGEFDTFLDASNFYDECLELGRFNRFNVTDIVRRDIATDNSDYVTEYEMFRRVMS